MMILFRYIFVILILCYSNNIRADILDVASSGTIEEVSDELKRTKDINIRDNKGLNALMMASVYNSDAKVVALLANSGVNLNDRTKTGTSALMLAAAYTKNVKVINALIDYGANLDAKNGNNKANALMIAIKNNPVPQIAARLMNSAIDLNAQDIYGNTALFFTIKRKELKLFRYLLEFEPELDIQNKKGETALIYAARKSDIPEYVSILLDVGANANLKDKNGKKAIDYLKENTKLKNSDVYWRLRDATN